MLAGDNVPKASATWADTLRRFMRFADGEVDARTEELAGVVRAWCAFAERG